MPEITLEEMFGTMDEKAHVALVPDASSGDGLLRSSSQCMEWAEKLGCVVIEAADSQLFIDLDSDLQYRVFQQQLPLLKKHFYYKSVKVTPSKQGLPHRHVVIEMGAAYSLAERIALQACLGSDPTRELLSIRRCINKEENVVIFFEKKVVD